MTQPYTIVPFGDRTYQVADARGLRCGWHRLTREQAERECERRNKENNTCQS